MIAQHTINLAKRGIEIPFEIKKDVARCKERRCGGSHIYGYDLNLSQPTLKQYAKMVMDKLIKDVDTAINYGPHFTVGKNEEIFMIVYTRTRYAIPVIKDRVHTLDSLGLSRTSIDNLVGMGCYDLSDLSRFSDEELLKVRGLGPKTLATLRGFGNKSDRIEHLLQRKHELEKELKLINTQLNLLEGN